MSVDFLIAYDNNSKDYLFYSDNKNYDKVAIGGILQQKLTPFAPIYVSCTEEETVVEPGVIYYFYNDEEDSYDVVANPQGSPYENEYYRKQENVVYNLCNTEIITEVFELQNSNQTQITLEQAPQQVETFIASVGENQIDCSISVNGNIITITFAEQIIEPIRFQISYVVAKVIQENDTYVISLYDTNDILIQELSLTCIFVVDLYCLGDYKTYLGIGDEETPNVPEVVITEEVEPGLYAAPIIANLEYTTEEEIEYRYKVIFGPPLNTQEYICYAKSAIVNGQLLGYLGNLSILTGEVPEVDLPFLITTISETSTLYTQTQGEFVIDISPYNLIEVPSLAGGTLLSFGNKRWNEETQEYEPIKENYGIGINSSDTAMGFPARAISLFETSIHPEESVKVSYVMRGILGTLPSGLDLSPGIANSLEGTQGIYTNNMYIGDSNQYVAYYRDINDNLKPKLDINGSVRIGSGVLSDVVNIENGSISLGNPEGFHIFIDSDTTHKYTWGLGFYAGSHKPEYILTADTTVVPGKDYYRWTGTRYEKIDNPSGNPELQGWFEEKDRRIAYIDANRLLVPYTVVLNGTEIGNEWLWELQPDTKNLTLKWIGED